MGDPRVTRDEPIRTAMRAGEWSRACVLIERALRANPGDAMLLAMMCEAQLRSGQPARVAHYARRAMDLAPNDATIGHGCLACLEAAGERGMVIELGLRLLDRLPGHWAARALVGAALLGSTRILDAARVLREGLAMAGAPAMLLANYQIACLAMGRAREAFDAGSRAIGAGLRDAGLLRVTAFSSNYVAGVPHAAALDLHRAFGRAITRPGDSAAWASLARGRGARAGPVRVGLASPDFRDHAVSRFLEGVFKEHDRGRVALYCYALSSQEDFVTRELRAHAAAWRCVEGDAVRDAMRNDALDVAVDLCGLTTGNALEAFAARVAPVQVTAIGYPTTTGLPTMDFRLVDEATDPAPASDSHCEERLVRLPGCFLHYSPSASAPREAARREGDQRIVFGSFNNLAKHSDQTLALWSSVLASVEGSRLLVKSMAWRDAGVAADFTGRCARAGIDPARLMLEPYREDQGDHFRAYAMVDIALDTTPYNGTTTTCEALWMGVPVVTLAGDRHASRVGASLLRAVGMGELVAGTPEEYASIAKALTEDAARRAALREGLRGRMRASSLCDGRGYARRFEDAMLAIASTR